MNAFLWTLQIVAALMYGASGIMKAFMFDRISEGVKSFSALPRQAWVALGMVELACVIGLIAPGALHLKPTLTVLAATTLAVESLVFVWVHVKFNELPAIIMSASLGLMMAFIAFGRLSLRPSF